MTQVSIGDLSVSYRTLLSNVRLKTDLQRLGQELASGRTTDLRSATGGDLGNLAGLENALNGLQAYKTSASEAALFVESVQRSLETIQQTTSEIGPALLTAGSTGEATLIQATATDARSRFLAVVSILNTKVADRALLAGTSVGSDALVSAEAMLTDLQAAVAAETTAAGVAGVVEDWFDDAGGGFETNAYLGATTDLAPFQIGPDEEARLGLRADTQELRDLMTGYAMAALVADGNLGIGNAEEAELVETAALRLLNSDKALAVLRAGIGGLEARIENAKARNSAETSALEIARAGIVEIDPYKAATELTAAEAQLETLYAITARLSRLSLAEFLR